MSLLLLVVVLLDATHAAQITVEPGGSIVLEGGGNGNTADALSADIAKIKAFLEQEFGSRWTEFMGPPTAPPPFPPSIPPAVPPSPPSMPPSCSGTTGLVTTASTLVSCSGDGWALAFRMVCPANTMCWASGSRTADALAAPPRPDVSPGASTAYVSKLADATINSIRSGAVANDLKITVYHSGLIGTSYHKKECTFTSTSHPATSDPCAYSTLDGATATNYAQSGHAGIARWYVTPATSMGYIFPSIHIGPAGSLSHSQPSPYCVPVDGARKCPSQAIVEWWVHVG